MKPYGLIPAFLVACAFWAVPAGADAATYKAIHSFGSADGVSPSANGISPYGVIADAAGNLYGVTVYGGTAQNGCTCGTIFELSPPAAAGGAWTETTLYSFTGGAEGKGPLPYLAMDGSGALYGGMGSGGHDACGGGSGCGTVFRLAPPASAGAAWTFQLIHTFGTATEGDDPSAQLVVDPSGAVYGTTQNGGSSADCAAGCGVVFKLTPPETGTTTWNYNVIHNFGHQVNGAVPYRPLIEDAGGALYGATLEGGDGYGVLFRLAPPAAGQAVWSYSVVHTFQVPANGYSVPALVLGQNGILYGSAALGGDNCQSSDYGCGTIFSLTPPAAGQAVWRYNVLHTFERSANGAAPDALVLDANGTLYGATFEGGTGSCSYGCGTVFALSPPAAGATSWRYSVLQSIGHPVNGAYPWGTTVEGPAHVLYGTTRFGGDPDCKNGQPSSEHAAGCGVVYQVTP